MTDQEKTLPEQDGQPEQKFTGLCPFGNAPLPAFVRTAPDLYSSAEALPVPTNRNSTARKGPFLPQR